MMNDSNQDPLLAPMWARVAERRLRAERRRRVWLAGACMLAWSGFVLLLSWALGALVTP